MFFLYVEILNEYTINNFIKINYAIIKAIILYIHINYIQYLSK